MLKPGPPIIIEQVFSVPINRLWEAITEVVQMRQWFFENIPSFKPEVGFETSFDVENEGRVFPHRWKITEVEPPNKISYNWSYDGYAGDSFATFELKGEGDGCLLRLTHAIVEPFPSDIPEFSRENCIGGWNYFVKERLVNVL